MHEGFDIMQIPFDRSAIKLYRHFSKANISEVYDSFISGSDWRNSRKTCFIERSI